MSINFMGFSEHLKFKLQKKFAPSSMISMRYKGNDIVFKTDEEGNPITVFIGKKNEKGTIKGERYVRTLKKDGNGVVFKDHWELKGKAI